jgi:hypothetical protein
MQVEYRSDSGGASEASETPLGEAANVGFTITAQDKCILQHHLEEFQKGDTPARTQLIERAMGELYRLRPVHTPFDKLDAKKVWTSNANVQSACSLIVHCRKYRSGSIITTILPDANTSSSPANGLLGMYSINSIEMKCRST